MDAMTPSSAAPTVPADGPVTPSGATASPAEGIAAAATGVDASLDHSGSAPSTPATTETSPTTLLAATTTATAPQVNGDLALLSPTMCSTQFLCCEVVGMSTLTHDLAEDHGTHATSDRATPPAVLMDTSLRRKPAAASLAASDLQLASPTRPWLEPVPPRPPDPNINTQARPEVCAVAAWSVVNPVAQGRDPIISGPVEYMNPHMVCPLEVFRMKSAPNCALSRPSRRPPERLRQAAYSKSGLPVNRSVHQTEGEEERPLPWPSFICYRRGIIPIQTIQSPQGIQLKFVIEEMPQILDCSASSSALPMRSHGDSSYFQFNGLFSGCLNVDVAGPDFLSVIAFPISIYTHEIYVDRRCGGVFLLENINSESNAWTGQWSESRTGDEDRPMPWPSFVCHCPRILSMQLRQQISQGIPFVASIGDLQEVSGCSVSTSDLLISSYSAQSYFRFNYLFSGCLNMVVRCFVLLSSINPAICPLAST